MFENIDIHTTHIVVTDLLRLLNAEMRQKYILHQFYILNFVSSYVMDTNEPPHDKTNKMIVRPAKTQMSRLIWVFAGRKVHVVGFLMRRLKLMLVSVLHIYQTSFENKLFSLHFSIEHTGSIQIHSTFWIFKMSSAIDSPCSGNKKLVFKIKVWQNLRE